MKEEKEDIDGASERGGADGWSEEADELQL